MKRAPAGYSSEPRMNDETMRIADQRVEAPLTLSRASLGLKKGLVMPQASSAITFKWPEDDRRHHRQALRLELGVVGDAGTVKRLVAHNISQTGLLVETDVDLPIGRLITVDLPSGPRSAEVVWSDDRFSGCKFVEEASSATVSAAILQAPFELPPASILGAGESSFTVSDNETGAGNLEISRLPLWVRGWSILGLIAGSWAAIGTVATLLVG